MAAMRLAHLPAPLWDEVAARCPAAADRAALALCCRAGADAARRLLRCAGLTPSELPALAAAAAAGRLPALERLVLGAPLGATAEEIISLDATRSLSALTGLTEMYALHVHVEKAVAAAQPLIATLGALPRLRAVALTQHKNCKGAVGRGLARLTQLQILELRCGDRRHALRDADAAAIAALTGLTALRLLEHRLTSAGLGPLLAGMARLEELDISGNWNVRLADPPTADALAALPRLHSLAAVHRNFLAGGAAPLVRLTMLGRVALDAWLCPDNLVVALARLPALRAAMLQSVAPSALAPLADAAATRLHALFVRGMTNQAGLDSVLRFTRLTHLFSPNLASDRWRPGDAGAGALACTLLGLVDLILPDCGITWIGATALAASLTRLTRLELSRSPLGDAGAAALAGGRLHGLLELHCCDAGIGDAGAAAIAAGLTALTRLGLSGNSVAAAGATALAGMRALRCLRLRELQGLPAPAGGVVDPRLERRLQDLDTRHLVPKPGAWF